MSKLLYYFTDFTLSFMIIFSSMWAENFKIHKLGLEKAEEPEIKLPTYAGSYTMQGNSSKTSTSVSFWRHAEYWPFGVGFSFPEASPYSGLGFLLCLHQSSSDVTWMSACPGQYLLTFTNSSCAWALPARKRVRALNPGSLIPVFGCRALWLFLRLWSFYININRSVSFVSAAGPHSQARLAECTPVAWPASKVWHCFLAGWPQAS